jgi:hypothetical protein
MLPGGYQRGGSLSQYLRRLTSLSQMDTEYTLWQMLSVLS